MSQLDPTNDANRTDGQESTLDLRVATVLQDWMQRREAGIAESPADLVTKHPELQPQLGDCIESVVLLDASGFCCAEPTTTAWKLPDLQIPDFRITGHLGRGGMGIVYDALQESLDRPVALKILPQTSVDPMAAQRFQREAETAAALHHPNIVPVYGVGQHEGVHWYAMQRIDGHPLSQTLADHTGGIDLDEVVRIGIESAGALQYAHDKGVIHRDIKPGNFLLADDGHIWLTDFGLARREADATATVTGALLGTPRYMSPETVFQTRGVVPDHRSDIYSLGATLYELATGAALFDGPTPLDVLQQIRTADPPSPTAIRSGLPRDLEVVLQKCLAKSVTDRYQSAADLQSDLMAIRDGLPIKARGVPLWTIARRKLQRNSERLRLVAMAIAATLLIGAVLYAMIQQNQGSALGKFQIAAAGGPFTTSAYRVDENGVADAAQITTTVPMQSDAEVPQSEYEFRLASHGHFSEAARLAVDVNRPTRARYVDRRISSEGVPIGEKYIETVTTSGGNEFLATLDADELRVFGTNEIPLTNVNVSQIDDEVDYAFHANNGWTNNSVARNPYYAKPRRLMTQTIDVEGKPQVVVTARTAASLAAIGQDGDVTWSTNIDLPPVINPGKPAKPSNPPVELPAVMEVRLLDDINDDGTQDLLVNVTRNNPDLTLDPFLVTLCGRTGETIAIAKLPRPVLPSSSKLPLEKKYWPTDGALDYITPGNEIRPFHSLDARINGVLYSHATSWEHPVHWAGRTNSAVVPMTPPVRIVRWENQTVAVTVSDSAIDVWDTASGQRVGQPITLPFTIAASPVIVRRGEKLPPAFCVWSQSTDSGKTLDTISVVSPIPHDDGVATGILWKSQRPVRWREAAVALERTDFPLAEDLDGDGVDELLIAEDRDHYDAKTSVICLNVADGKPRWSRPATLHCLGLAAQRPTVLGDFDNDGVRDIAIASIHGRREAMALRTNVSQLNRFSLFVDLISGETGESIRFWQEPLATTSQNVVTAEVDHLVSDGASVIEVSTTTGELKDTARVSTTIRMDLASDSPPEMAPGVTRLNLGSRIASGFYRQRPGVDELYDDRAFWINKEAPSKLRSDAHVVLATWTDKNDRSAMLVRESESSLIRAVDGVTGRELWRHVATQKTKAAPVLDAHGQSASVMIQPLNKDDSPKILDAKSGRVICEIQQPFGIPQSVSICDDNPGAIWILAYASFDGQTQFGLRGMLLICADASTGKTRWLRQFFRSLNPRSYQSYGDIRILRLDCDGDGVADAVVPDGDDRELVDLIAISGVDGEPLWKTKTSLLVDRWEAGSAWPPVAVGGPETDQRIVLFDGNNRAQSKHSLRMLSAARGVQLDEQPIEVNQSYRRMTSQFARLEVGVVNPQADWPRISIAYPKSPGVKVWQEFEIGKDGFSISDRPLIEQKGLRSHQVLVDVDLDGVCEHVVLDDKKLTCRDDRGTRWSVDTSGWNRFDRIHQLPRQRPMLGVYNEDDVYRLVSLADGKTLWTSPRRQLEAKEQSRMPANTPVLLESADGLTLVRTTREGVRSIRVVPHNAPTMLAGTSPTIDPRTRRRPIGSLGSSGQTAWTILGSFLRSTFFALFAVAIPAAYVLRGIRRRRFTLAYLMIAPVVAAAALLTWNHLLSPVRLDSEDVNQREHWALILVGGCFVIAFIAYLWGAVQNRRWWRIAVGLLFSISLLVPTVVIPFVATLAQGNEVVYDWRISDIAIMLLVNFMFVFTLMSLQLQLIQPLWIRLFRPSHQPSDTEMVSP